MNAPAPPATTRLYWPRKQCKQVRFPNICLLTGVPTTTTVKVAARRWKISAFSRGRSDTRLVLPVCDEVAARVRRGRVLAIAAGVLGGLLMITYFGGRSSGPIWEHPPAYGWAIGGFVLLVAVALFIASKLCGSSIVIEYEDQWMYVHAHWAFAQETRRINPPGMVYTAEDLTGLTQQQEQHYQQWMHQMQLPDFRAPDTRPMSTSPSPFRPPR